MGTSLLKNFPKGLFVNKGKLRRFNRFRDNFFGISGPTPIATLDWTPQVYSGLDPSGTASYHWDFQDTGTTITESIAGSGTHDLTAQGNTAQGQTASGLSDGTNLSERKCGESINPGSSSTYRWEGANQLAAAEGSVAFRVAFRIPYNPGLRYICGNYHTANSGVGWFLELHNGRFPQLHVRDTSTNLGTVPSTVAVSDGAWHCVEGVIDWAANEARLRVDGTAIAALDISSLVQANTDTTALATAFRIGSIAGINPGPPIQVTDFYGWEGEAAENLDSEDWDDVWPYFKDPLAGTPYEDDTISFAGVHACPTNLDHRDDHAGDGLWYMVSGDAGQFPIGYSSLLETRGAPNGFGRWNYFSAATPANLVVQSERLEVGWTTSNATVSASAANLADNKLGFRAARKITATADNGYIETPSITVSSSQEHQACVWVKGAGGTVTGRLIAYDNSGATETASTTFSVADGVFERFGFEFTTASTDYTIRLEIDSSGDAVHACHFGLRDSNHQQGWKYAPIVPTYGAAATSASTNGNAEGLSATDWPDAAGTFITHWIGDDGAGDSGGNNWFAIQARDSDNGNSNRFHLQAGVASSSASRMVIYDDSGTAAGTSYIASGHPVNSTNDEGAGYRLFCIWDSQNEIAEGVYSRLYQIGDGDTFQANGATSAYDTSGAEVDQISFMSGCGMLGYTQIYDTAYLPEDLE